MYSSISLDRWVYSRDSPPIKIQNSSTAPGKFSPLSSHWLLAEATLGQVLNFIEWKPNVFVIHSDSWMHPFTHFYCGKVLHYMGTAGEFHDLFICSLETDFWIVFSLGLMWVKLL